MSVPNEDSDDSQQRKAPDAQKSEASIYKLYSKDPEIKDIYIRCTKRILTHMRKHYYTCRTSNTPRHNVYLYRLMREPAVGMIGRTRSWRRLCLPPSLKATLNTDLPNRTDQERKINARRRARYAKQQQNQQEKAIPVKISSSLNVSN